MYFSGSARGMLLNLYLLDFFEGGRNLLCYKSVKMFTRTIIGETLFLLSCSFLIYWSRGR